MLAFKKDDERLAPLLEIACKAELYIVAGAPLQAKGLLEIGAVIISPEGEISSYSKMNLHSGEDKYFKPGNSLKTIEIENQKIALAICADTNNPMHAKAYAENGASVYVAGVLIGEDGYAQDTQNLYTCAKQYNMLVTIANHNGPTGGWAPVGKSAAWSKEGNLAVANVNSSSLVISQQVRGQWMSEVIKM